jgi:hypothetical protein
VAQVELVAAHSAEEVVLRTACVDGTLHGVKVGGNPHRDAGRNLERAAALVEAYVTVADEVVECGDGLTPHRQPPELQRAALEQSRGEPAVKGAKQR